MARETYRGMPLKKSIGGKTHEYHSAYGSKRDANQVAASLRDKMKWAVRIVKLGNQYVLYTRPTAKSPK